MRLIRSLSVMLVLGACNKEGTTEPAPVAADDAAQASTPPADDAAAVAETVEADTAPAATEVAAAAEEVAPDTAVAAAEPETTVADAVDTVRETIKALAVGSECLRKQGLSAEQMSQTMLALYRAHGIDLDTYAREMGRLGGDPSFQAEVQAAVAACPTTVAVVDPVTPEVVEAADAVAPSDTAEPAPDVVVVVADVAEPKADVVAPADAVAAADVVAPTDTSEEPKPETKLSGTWSGSLSGNGANGTLRMTVSGRSITSGSATFGRTKLTLKGSIGDNGAVNLAGRSGDSFIRVRGSLDKGKTSISATYDGTIDKKKVGGKVRISK